MCVTHPYARNSLFVCVCLCFMHNTNDHWVWIFVMSACYRWLCLHMMHAQLMFHMHINNLHVSFLFHACFLLFDKDVCSNPWLMGTIRFLRHLGSSSFLTSLILCQTSKPVFRILDASHPLLIMPTLPLNHTKVQKQIAMEFILPPIKSRWFI